MFARAVSVVDDAQDAAVLLKPEHKKLLELLRTPNSASGLAREMGWSRQIAGYHMKEMENAGLVALHEERKRGNCTERVMRRTAAAYVIGPATLGPLAPDPEDQPDKLSASYLVSVAARIIREISKIMRAAEQAGKTVPTMTLDTEIRFRSASERSAFTTELAEQMAQLVRKYHDDQSPGGRSFRLVTGAYPLITKKTERKGDSNAEDSAT